MDAEDGELINWFRCQEKYWIDRIMSNNNPCYNPMIMAFTTNKKSTVVMLKELKIADHGKDIVRMLIDGASKENDDVLAVMYYFHTIPEHPFCDDCPLKRLERCNLKVTVANFHLFSKHHDVMLDKARHVIYFHEGKTTDDDNVEVKEVKNDDILPDGTIMPAWENPFNE